MTRAIALALACACACACAAPPARGVDPASLADPPAPRLPGLELRGMALGLWDFAARPADDDWGRELDEIAALGADHVLLPVHWRQRDVRAPALAPHPAATIPDARLRAVVRAAHARGLGVVLFPIVEVERLGPGAWRGTLAPPDVDVWWASYREFLLRYATLATEEGVAWLSVGSELGFSEQWRDRWYALIGEVRRGGYRGRLLYSANWDRYRQVSFWARLDAVGVSAYFEVAPDAERAWRAARRELVGYAAAVGLPLVLTEVGYPSLRGGMAAPWDYTRQAPVDLEEQRRAFAAFVRAWDGEAALAGVSVWVWWGEGGARDGGYTVRGKPAAAVVRRLFAATGQTRSR